MRFFNIFKRKEFKVQPKQLRIDGTKATLTPAPDDAELAAQALLELRIYGDKTQRKAAKKRQPSDISHQPSDQPKDAQYYQQLSEKIRTAREAERRSAMRYLSYCEQELSTPLHHREGQGESPFAELEHGLFKFQDVIDREGGELKSRWQRCLAECIVRQMVPNENENETTNDDS